ncbi:MAG: hypothetical protein C0417_08910 [Chlorobiaceae bacterium]|nr:hypothetical protein [Chlorobiaceae bacterium]
MTKRSINFIMIFYLLFIPLVSTTAQNSKVSWFSFNMGYGQVESSNLKIKSVVGQQFVGTVMYNDFQVISGFLADTLFGGTLVSVVDGKELPKTFSLDQNYPNPFNPSTKIKFAIPRESHVTLKVYDILGQEVTTLVNEVVQPGYHEISYVGSRLTSGVYFYRLVSNDYVSMKKFILLK